MIYLFLGILTNFLYCWNVIVFQQIIDSCQTVPLFENLRSSIILYGLILLSANIMAYLQNYPEKYLENAIVEQLKLMSLEKYQKLNIKIIRKLEQEK